LSWMAIKDIINLIFMLVKFVWLLIPMLLIPLVYMSVRLWGWKAVEEWIKQEKARV
jgi:hypothetical protein